MFRTALRRIHQPEPQSIPWGLPLPIWLSVAYLSAILIGLLMVTTWRDDRVSDPDAVSLILAGIIGGGVTLWLIVQNIRKAASTAAEKSKHQSPTLKLLRLLSLTESQSRPLWIVWLVAFAGAVTLDTIVVILGKPQKSFPPGLDRIEGAGWATWVLAVILLVGVRPVVEELIFRGILYPVLAGRFADNVQAVVATAGLFAGLYLVQVFNSILNWNVLYWGLVYPLVLGLAAGLARAHTKSTLSAIGVHAMFGLFLVLNALVTLA